MSDDKSYWARLTMLMLQYFPSSHHANRANNGALMKISRQNAAAQTAAWIAINFPFCWHEEKNEHCLHVWLLHKSNLVFFSSGKIIYEKKRQAENNAGRRQTKDWHGRSGTPFLFHCSAVSYQLSTPALPDLQLVNKNLSDCPALQLSIILH